jgi:threonine dehydratase
MDALTPDTLPTHDDVRRAAERIRPVATLTPLIEAPLLNEELGGRLLVKCDMLQKTGSFKFRGAYNRISMIPEAERGKGVVAFSSGNHAQGVAAAAKLLGVRAAIIMPSDAPAMKIANTRAYGAEVLLYDRFGESRDEIAARLSRERGSTLVKPFDDPGIIAGQGTIGLEIAAQVKALGVRPDAVLAACSGGGLVTGIASDSRPTWRTSRSIRSSPKASTTWRGRSRAAGTRPMRRARARSAMRLWCRRRATSPSRSPGNG